MRVALALLFFVSLSTPVLLKLGIVAYYECNKVYIAQNLCENRSRPELNCCGKCYLRKQLAKADNEPSSQKPILAQLSKFEIAPFVLPERALAPVHVADEETKPEHCYNAPFPQEIAQAIFHPPG
jgi:hypothetical protein